LRSAQVEAFDAEARALRDRIAQLEREVDSAGAREEDLRIRLRAAEESLKRSEENLRRAVGGGAVPPQGEPVSDDDSKAVLEILRSRAQAK
jgi:cell division septum initiation protein DivIVA